MKIAIIGQICLNLVLTISGSLMAYAAIPPIQKPINILEKVDATSGETIFDIFKNIDTKYKTKNK